MVAYRPDLVPKDWLPPKVVRVAHVGPCLRRGGAERHAIALANNFDPKRVKMVKIVHTGADADFDPDVAREFPCPVVRGGKNEVRKAARECDMMLHWGGFDPEWLSDYKPPAVVYLAHGEGDWTRAGLDGAWKVTDHVIAVCESAGKLFPDFPTTVIHNGIDPRTITPTKLPARVRTSLGFSDDDFVVLFLGRFSEEKRPERVIEAVSMLPDSYKVLMVGWGKMESELRSLALSLIPDRCVFATADGDAGNCLSAADCLVIPSEREGGPLVLMEAMFAGCPVITTNVGMVPEVNAGRGFLRVMDGTPGRIAEAISNLCVHGDDRAEKARVYAWDHCLATTMADRYCDVFDSLLAKSTPRTVPTPTREDCSHRKESAGLVECQSCGGAVKAKTFHCEKRGRCSTFSKAIPGVVNCNTCGDYDGVG